MERNDYVEKYLNARKEMREAAIEKIKNYGKTLEVYEVCKQRVMERTEDFNPVDDADQIDEEIASTTYCCAFEGRHGMIYACNIVMVRYNEKYDDVDVYLESDEGDIAEWFSIAEITFEHESAYMTVLDFID